MSGAPFVLPIVNPVARSAHGAIIPVKPPSLHGVRTYAEHFAFVGACADLCGYFAHLPLTEGIGKAATIVACIALYIEHAEQKRIEKSLKM